MIVNEIAKFEKLLHALFRLCLYPSSARRRSSSLIVPTAVEPVESATPSPSPVSFSSRGRYRARRLAKRLFQPGCVAAPALQSGGRGATGKSLIAAPRGAALVRLALTTSRLSALNMGVHVVSTMRS